MKGNTITIAFPVVQIKLLGLPDFVRLSVKQAEAMKLYHLGGCAAWSKETTKVANNTIKALIRKGFFETKQSTDELGPITLLKVTVLGKCVAEGCAGEIDDDSLKAELDAIGEKWKRAMEKVQADLN